MSRRLGFYDHMRQRYADTVAPSISGAVTEFGVGDYYRDGSVGPRGELAIVLYDHSGVTRRSPIDHILAPQIQVFDDAYGTLRALDRLGVLNAIRRAKLRSGDDLSRLLIACGLRDCSDRPIDAAVAV